MNSNQICDVVLLAAGAARRMKGIKKQFEVINGLAVYEHALNSFVNHKNIGKIVVVVASNDAQELATKHAADDIIITVGGSERHLSVKAGLAQLQDSDADYVAIHDAARPFIPSYIIDDGIKALKDGHDGVIPVLPVADTIKQVDEKNETSIKKTLQRDLLRRVQTPQFFNAQIIKNLHSANDLQTNMITDDAMMLEAAGLNVFTIDGDERLDKITWQADLEKMKDQNMNFEFRTGTGFDVHRFSEGTGPIMICGIGVEHNQALDAHSDGDVGIHALCDAIFGALCDGDIGMHFPPSDDKWKDAESDQFLTYAVDKIIKAGAELRHVDVTILCETPKIGPHRDKMREQLASLCNIPISRVSVKATTTEKLGFTGRAEGIAAQAAATIALPMAKGVS